MINVDVNQASAVLRAPYGVFHSSPDARALMMMMMMLLLMEDVVTLAGKVSINLSQKDVINGRPFSRRWPPEGPEGNTSML